MKLTNNTLLCVATILVAVCLVVMHYQYKTIKDFKNIIEQTDTSATIKRDTIWRDTLITETQFVPKYIKELKRDTVYTKDGNTLELARESKRFDKRLTIDKDTADIAQHRTNHRRKDTVISTFPQKCFIKACGAHSNSPLHTDLAYTSMDVAVNGIDDIQNTDDTNEGDQYPAQHFNLCKALRHFVAALAVREPVRSRLFATPVIQPTFKGICIGIFFEHWVDFRIAVISKQIAV